MIISVHQPQYIPWLGYLDKIAKSDAFVFLDKVQYKPREFQNRNKIRRKGGWMWLSVPVIDSGGRQNLGEVRVDNGQDWQRTHKGSLKTWYGKAAFFKHHFPFFEELYSKQPERLCDVNVDVIRYLLKALSIGTPIAFESDLNISSTSTQRIIDICKAMKADTYLSGTGGRDYLEERLFVENGIKLVYQEFVHPEYEQLFDPFMPFLSSVDLLFTHGPGSRDILLGKK